MKIDKSIEIAEGRKALYGILSSIYLNEISPPLLYELQSAPVRSALSDFSFQTDALKSKGNNEDFINELEVEFTGLFIGPGMVQVSPYESVYFEKQIYGTAAFEAALFYERYGLSMEKSPSLKVFKLLPDHIGVEMQFMKLLVEKEIMGRKEENQDKASRALEIQKIFLTKHLGRWAKLFCEKVMLFASNPFYCEFAKLTEKFIQDEMFILENLTGESGIYEKQAQSICH